eukprot:CAMPEP_0116091162 /NCGR_PEP_ID=MMETSP0327-20121206/7358_1 /TAXON_ID=44447 /ORGANISM="Pseudo-nitzschia delicatissima, Strain B596" /LENGTH=443 /DNA_ID=CAMNT_0003582495 /DNA_START=138 /DNA_END=1469 /DNA_ORIENTATION=+
MANHEISGNLDLCIPKDGSGNVFLDVSDEHLCLSSVDGIVQPLIRSSNETDFRWQYDNGLLRSPNGLCLGPTVNALSAKGCEPYELVMQECPSDDDYDKSNPKQDPSWALTDSRRMRFIITAEGKVQSLAGVVNPKTLKDKSSSSPYCLTMAKEGEDEFLKAYLVPCQPDESSDTTTTYEGSFKGKEHKCHDRHHHFIEERQVFDVYGTYSGSFLMSLKCHWYTEEKVELAYQVGLPLSSSEATASVNFIEITTLYPSQGNNFETRVMDVIPLDISSGIISVEPLGSNLDGFGYQLDGKITATLRTTEGDGDNDDGLVLSEAGFFLSKTYGNSIVKAQRSFMVYIYTVGCFVACFFLSILAEKFLAKKVRSEGDGSNDGKTVCMSDQDDDEFPLDDNVEEGFGVIHIRVDKDASSSETDTDSNSDIDESRNSTITAIPRENKV